jgi:RNA polymerase sigma-70 factor (ECF subfamily)
VADGPDLTQIYRDHHAFVWRIVRRLGVSEAGVDDAVQEVFVVLHRRRDELDFSGSIRGLLYGIARRIAKRSRDKASAAAKLRVVGPTTAPENPEDDAAIQQKAAVLRAALEALDEGKRMTFVLADIEGMTIPEVAAAMNVNVNTSYARLRAARQKLGEAVARHRKEEEEGHVRSGT